MCEHVQTAPTNQEAGLGHVLVRKRDVEPAVLYMHCHSSVAPCCYTVEKEDLGQLVSTADLGAHQT